MAKLNAAKRNALPTSDFAEPGERKFPIEDRPHAKDALSRAGAKPPAEEAKIRAKVKKKFPGLGGPKYPKVAKEYVD